MSSPEILIAEDDAFQRELLAAVFRKQDLACHMVEHGRAVLDYMGTPSGQSIRVVILDLNMPVMDGATAMEHLQNLYPRLPVVILTGNHDMDKAVAMMKLGAFDYLVKPIKADRLGITVRNALQLSRLRHDRGGAAWRGQGPLHLGDLIGAQGSLADMIATARKIAATDVPVLLAGETGTGKDVLARAIHGDSPRAQGPFVAINCGAIPENLIESILFGHEKGAFTGATEKTPGKFREAENGTIFLDEIGDMPLAAQVRLLRVLQQHEIQPVGAAAPVPIHVRVISASHQDLAARVRAGTFREDLFYRLNVVPLTVPPLRMRPDDILPLAGHFIHRAHTEDHLPHRTLSADAANRLMHYRWPGNVRELENVIRRAMVLASGDVIQSYDLGLVEDDPQPPDGTAVIVGATQDQVTIVGPGGQLRPLDDIHGDILARAYQLCHHNISRMSQYLGISRATIYRWLENRQDHR